MTNFNPFKDAETEIFVVNCLIQGDLLIITNEARMSLFQELCFLMARYWRIEPRYLPKLWVT